jgi:hypothetical protein
MEFYRDELVWVDAQPCKITKVMYLVEDESGFAFYADASQMTIRYPNCDFQIGDRVKVTADLSKTQKYDNEPGEVLAIVPDKSSDGRDYMVLVQTDNSIMNIWWDDDRLEHDNA